LSTCSTTSIEQTTSNRFGSCTSISAGACRKDSVARPGSTAAWRVATLIFSADASMASVFAPRRARLCTRRQYNLLKVEGWGEGRVWSDGGRGMRKKNSPRTIYPRRIRRPGYPCPPARGSIPSDA
jgi:hypothetical protein